jgi:hypothetical protein
MTGTIAANDRPVQSTSTGGIERVLAGGVIGSRVRGSGRGNDESRPRWRSFWVKKSEETVPPASEKTVQESPGGEGPLRTRETRCRLSFAMLDGTFGVVCKRSIRIRAI